MIAAGAALPARRRRRTQHVLGPIRRPPERSSAPRKHLSDGRITLEPLGRKPLDANLIAAALVAALSTAAKNHYAASTPSASNDKRANDCSSLCLLALLWGLLRRTLSARKGRSLRETTDVALSELHHRSSSLRLRVDRRLEQHCARDVRRAVLTCLRSTERPLCRASLLWAAVCAMPLGRRCKPAPASVVLVAQRGPTELVSGQ